MPEITMRVEEGTQLILNGIQFSMADEPQNVYALVPRLVIEEQPAPVFRFRYQSEHGSHGSLMGESSDKSKKTYPRIRIEHFVGKVKIRVSLYTYKDEETNGPGSPGTPVKHVHMLHGKNCNKEAGVCEVECDVPAEGKSIEFQNLYISHVAKRTIPAILNKRYQDEHLVDMYNLAEVGWVDGQCAGGIDDETARNLKMKADTDAKNMEKKLNSVVLCFEAEALIQGSWVTCCEPVYSNPINNQKAAATGSLKICRIDRTAGTIKGGDEVFILCEKVDKKNIKVRFYKPDDDWEDFGGFNEFDVHHQFAIVFRTPKYKDPSHGEDVHVKIELYRPSDGAISNSVDFTYTPDDDYDLRRKKRKLIDCQNMGKDSTPSSCMHGPGGSFGDRKPGSLQLNCPSTSSFGTMPGTSAAGGQYVPTTAEVLDQALNLEQLNPFLPVPGGYTDASVQNASSFLSNLSSDPLLGQNQLSTPTFQDLMADTDSNQPFYDIGGSRDITLLSNLHDGNSLDIDFDLEVDSAGQIAATTKKSKDSKMVSRGPTSYDDDDDLQTDGIGSIGQTRPAPPTTTNSLPTIPARIPAAKHGQNGKMTDNELVYKLAYHTAKKLQDYARTSDIQHLLITMRHLTAVPDDNGDNAIHLASIHSQPEAIFQLVKVADRDPINAFNELIQTPLHIAVHVNNPKIAEALIQSGADVTLLDRHGNSALHIACKHGKADVVRVITNKKNYSKEPAEKLTILDSQNYSGFAPLHLAVLAKSLDCVKELCLAGANINVSDGTSGRTALHLAIENSCEDILRFLLTQDSIDVDCQAFSGYTPLHLACSMNLESIVKLLMKFDADPYMETCEPVQEQLSSDDEANTPDTDVAKPKLDEEQLETRGCNSFDIARDKREILEILNKVYTAVEPCTPALTTNPDLPPKVEWPVLEKETPIPSRPPADSGLGLEDEEDFSELKIQSGKDSGPGKDSGYSKDSGYIENKTPYDIIDEPTRNKLAKLLDGPGDKKWTQLTEILELTYLGSVFNSSDSPTLVLLQYIDTVDELYNGLDAMGHEEALDLLRNFLSEKDAVEHRSPVPDMTAGQDLSKKMSKLGIK